MRLLMTEFGCPEVAFDRTLSPVTATAVCMVLMCSFTITWCLFWETSTVVINDTDC